jgi:hypothetical protein
VGDVLGVVAVARLPRRGIMKIEQRNACRRSVDIRRSITPCQEIWRESVLMREIVIMQKLQISENAVSLFSGFGGRRTSERGGIRSFGRSMVLRLKNTKRRWKFS